MSASHFLVSSTLLLACGCSKSDDGNGQEGPPKACLSQCELAGSCEERAVEDYPDYEGTLSEWDAESRCGTALVFALRGECADGTRFLRTGTGYTTELRYFDDDGSFLSLTTTTDVSDQTCHGKSYWPEARPCEDAVVTTVDCGTIWGEGDTVEVPYADGVNP